ncbi:MAG: maltotransferase domain-containing protein, partial [Chloroflexota bacterium]
MRHLTTDTRQQPHVRQTSGGDSAAHLDTSVRAVIENVAPQVDCGRYPAKRVAGDHVTVEADIFTDGHDAVSAVLQHRMRGTAEWSETAFEPLVNDRWQARFLAPTPGRYEFTVLAWVDHFKSWQRDLRKKVAAEQEVDLDLLIGADLAEQAAARADSSDET